MPPIYPSDRLPDKPNFSTTEAAEFLDRYDGVDLTKVAISIAPCELKRMEKALYLVISDLSRPSNPESRRVYELTYEQVLTLACRLSKAVYDSLGPDINVLSR